MPLGERGIDNKGESRYCGVETEFSDDVPQLLSFNLSHGGFDFVVAPLMNPFYRPSSLEKCSDKPRVPPFAGSDLVVNPSRWSSHVVGNISSWIDLDSDDLDVQIDSETTLKQEIAWASHLSLQACLLPTPKRASCANYARCVNQILQGLNNMQLWLRVPLVRADNESIDETFGIFTDYWEMWNLFRQLCEHDRKLSVALDVLSSLPSENSIARWFGEPVRAAIVNTNCFLTNARGYPCLSKRHQKLITGFFNHSVQIVISGKPLHEVLKGNSDLDAVQGADINNGVQSHLLRPYLEYVGYIYQKMNPLPEQEQFELGYRDFLQSPLQPLMDNLEAQTYETFEKDSIKYIQYQRAIAKALMDRVSDKNALSSITVLMVVGAGRGPLVRASLQAAEETGRRIKVYAVEKNPNAIVTLHSLLKLEGWENSVNIVSSDMRYWDAPEKADILVSELLGSFGDNELSPECLDGAQRFLKEDGISIPSSLIVKEYRLARLSTYVRTSATKTSWILVGAPGAPFSAMADLCDQFSNVKGRAHEKLDNILQKKHISAVYTSFIQPVTASKLHNDVKLHKDLVHFETAYVVKLHSVARLAPTQPVFTFNHPNHSTERTNQRFKRLQFQLPADMGSALVHGFAGYFDAVLYGDIHLGIEPLTATPNMFSWFPIFFPLRIPVCIQSGGSLEAMFWRCVGSTKVWYEWCVTSPSPSAIHNSNGRSYWVGL